MTVDWSRVCLGSGAAAVLGYFALPGGAPQTGVHVAVGAVSSVLVLAGSWRAPSGLRRGWWLIACAQLLWSGADGLSGSASAGSAAGAAVPWASAAYLGGYAPMLAGLVLLAARMRRGADLRAAVLDSAAFMTGAGLVAWQLLIRPGFDGDASGGLYRLVSAAYPLADVALVGALGVVALVVPHQVSCTGWYRLLTASLLLLLVTDAVYRPIAVAGTYSRGDVLDAGWMGSYVLVAAAALHPSTRDPLPRTRGSSAHGRPSARFSRGRLAALTLALMCVPFALFAEETLLHDTHGSWVVIGACVLLFTILVTRLGGLIFASQEDGARLEVVARTDSLTGLANRSRLTESFHRILASPDSYPLSVLVVDLDRFKDINDTFGHAVGDLVLREVGRCLTGIAGDDDVVARTGGDEFTIIAPRAGAEPVAEDLGRRIRACLGRPLQVDGLSLLCEGSVGVAWAAQQRTKAGTLLRHADVALYVAKTHPAGVLSYRPHQERGTVDRMTLLGELERALTDGELVLHYQPQVSLSTGRTTGVEALIRWQHPDRGLLGPEAFLEAAEQTGLIVALTRTVLDLAARQARTWCDQGRSLQVSVNLSSRNLRDTTLVDDVRTALRTHHLSPSRLTLEITESSVMSDPERSLRVLTRLRNMGVRLSVDDYGTGYSSLAYLQRLPVDELKIDKSFVTNLGLQRADGLIVQSTIELAARLGLGVVAEGVEDDAVLSQLRAWGCPTAQGYHLGSPCPPEQLF